MAAKFRLIDMVCNIIAPVVIGQVITFVGRPIAAIVFSVQVMLTLILFCFLLGIIYRRLSRLHYREIEESVEDDSKKSLLSEDDKDLMVDSNAEQSSNNKKRMNCLTFIDGWIVYFKQSIRLAGLALAFLYMTVLGFDSVTIGYSLSQGVSESILSFFNAGAAITGVIGALLFPHIMRYTNVVFTGIISLSLQFLGLIPCILSVWAPGSPFNLFGNNTSLEIPQIHSGNITVTAPAHNEYLSVILLMSGIIASRVGLWMFDLTTNQLLTESVMEKHRGKVNGVQNSLNMLFDLIKFMLVFIWPLPNQFGLLVLLSVSSIGVANILYIIFAVLSKCKIVSRL